MDLIIDYKVLLQGNNVSKAVFKELPTRYSILDESS